MRPPADRDQPPLLANAQQSPAASGQRPPPKRRTGLIVGLTVTLLVLLGAGFCAVIVISAAQPGELSPAERRAMVTIDDVAAWAGIEMEIDRAAESWDISRLPIFNTLEADYEYDGDEMYVSSGLVKEVSASDAQSTYHLYNLGMKIGLSMEEDAEMETEERDDLLRWGDRSRSFQFLIEGEPLGHLFVAQKGDTVFYLVVAGLATEDPEEFAGWLQPHLAAIQ